MCTITLSWTKQCVLAQHVGACVADFMSLAIGGSMCVLFSFPVPTPEHQKAATWPQRLHFQMSTCTLLQHASSPMQDMYADAEACAHEVARCYGRRTHAASAAAAQYLCLAQVCGSPAEALLLVEVNRERIKSDGCNFTGSNIVVYI